MRKRSGTKPYMRTFSYNIHDYIVYTDFVTCMILRGLVDKIFQFLQIFANFCLFLKIGRECLHKLYERMEAVVFH
jgi:hypothetical protein